MMNQQSKRPVTIEDLLRLKRAERPSSEFWSEFDQELRAKQLAALVGKRPWWRSLPRAFHGLGRYHLPLGATAVLAVTLLSIRDYHPVLPNASTATVDGTALRADSTATGNETTSSAESITTGDAVAANATATSTTSSPLALSSEASAPGQLVRMVPSLSAESPSANQAELRPSTRSMAENLAVAEAILGTPASGFETRALPSRPTPREPLAQMANPAETRRSRFAAAFASMAGDTSTITTARVARRLSDEQLYDSIHRFGASGNSVSFKF